MTPVRIRRSEVAFFLHFFIFIFCLSRIHDNRPVSLSKICDNRPVRVKFSLVKSFYFKTDVNQTESRDMGSKSYGFTSFSCMASAQDG